MNVPLLSTIKHYIPLYSTINHYKRLLNTIKYHYAPLFTTITRCISPFPDPDLFNLVRPHNVAGVPQQLRRSGQRPARRSANGVPAEGAWGFCWDFGASHHEKSTRNSIVRRINDIEIGGIIIVKIVVIIIVIIIVIVIMIVRTIGSEYWLVAYSTYPLKNMSSSIGMMKFAISGKIENVPKHQPVVVRRMIMIGLWML